MGKSPSAVARAHSAILREPGQRKLALVSRAGLQRPQVRIVQGRSAVLEQLGTLSGLCARSGQEDAARWLEFQMDTPNERKKIPTLVLLGEEWSAGAGLRETEQVYGAAILYEYKIAGCGLRVFAGDDSTGRRSVIGPKHKRAKIAEAVCDGLLERGALAAMLSYDGEATRESPKNSGSGLSPGSRVAIRRRSVPLYISLGSSFEETLSRLGRHTRRNLRYYRKRAEMTLGVEFVAHANLSRDEFLRSNLHSANPVSASVARWRYDAFSNADGMLFAGVRSRDGRWVSLIGGRRHCDMVEIDWQVNLGELPRLSVSTVMRSYLLEHEVGLGTRTLVFNGGTPHPMRHSFVSVDVMDALAVRDSRAGRMLRAIAPWLLPKTNFLVQALCDPTMA